MSRTDAHAPLWVRLARAELAAHAQHTAADDRCDLPPRPTEGHRHGARTPSATGLSPTPAPPSARAGCATLAGTHAAPIGAHGTAPTWLCAPPVSGGRAVMSRRSTSSPNQPGRASRSPRLWRQFNCLLHHCRRRLTPSASSWSPGPGVARRRLLRVGSALRTGPRTRPVHPGPRCSARRGGRLGTPVARRGRPVLRSALLRPGESRVDALLEEQYPVDEYHDGAGGVAVRNQRMVDRGADVCLAFIGPASKGSVDCMTRAQTAGTPVIVHGPKVGPPVPSATLCCSVCVRRAIEHGADGCQGYGGFGECRCDGDRVDPADIE